MIWIWVWDGRDAIAVALVVEVVWGLGRSMSRLLGRIVLLLRYCFPSCTSCPLELGDGEIWERRFQVHGVLVRWLHLYCWAEKLQYPILLSQERHEVVREEGRGHWVRISSRVRGAQRAVGCRRGGSAAKGVLLVYFGGFRRLSCQI